jgi:predicted RNase H-like HicB family nuclease
MIQEYLEAGMHLAQYELLAGDEGFYAEIVGVQGVWANAPTLEQCRTELYSALEEWVLLSIRLGDALPVLNGIELNAPELVA